MKKIMLSALLGMFSILSFGQKTTFQLSSHILDISKGEPAPEVTIKLEKYNAKTKMYQQVDEKITDKNGRVTDFLNAAYDNKGIYKLTFFTSDYFKKSNVESFYPFIEIVFQIKDDKHYHVPITLSAFGYSTYRGN